MHVASPSNQIEVLSYADSSAITGAPKFMLLGGKLVYAPANADADAVAGYITKARINGAPKTTGEAWTINVALYWVAGTSKLSTTSSGNTLAGYAAAAAGSADTTGDINLISLNP